MAQLLGGREHSHHQLADGLPHCRDHIKTASFMKSCLKDEINVYDVRLITIL